MVFTDILQELGVAYVREGKHCRPGWVNFDCPHCGRGSGKHHMGFHLQQRYVHCWRCGKHSLVETVATLAGIEYRAAKKMLAGLQVSKILETVERRGTLKLPKCIGPMQRPHRAYLESLGFDPAELERTWNVQGIGIAPRLAWRLFIPFTYEKEVVSFTTRSIKEDAEQRYISAAADEEVIDHKTILYGEEKCGHAALAVEGPKDAWRMGPGTVALCGTGFSRAQLRRLSRFLVRGVCFDNEPEAQARADQLVTALSVFPGETYKIQLDAEDPGSASRKEVRQVREALGL